MAVDELQAQQQCIDALVAYVWSRFRQSLPDQTRQQMAQALQGYAPADVAWAMQRYMASMGLAQRRRGPPDAKALCALLEPELGRRKRARDIASVLVAQAFIFEPKRQDEAQNLVGEHGRFVVDDMGGWARLRSLMHERGLTELTALVYEAVLARLVFIDHQRTIARLRKMTAAVQHG